MMEPKQDIQLFGTSNLCFDKDSFMRPEFDVDDFMRDYQCSGDGNLETLRDHLGVYLKILRSAMIDLINRDYADFVNLSTNLTGLDNLIQALSVPLGQLREEVLSVSQLLENTSNEILTDIDKEKAVQKYKQKLNTLAQMSARLDSLEGLMENDVSEKSAAEDGDPEESLVSDLDNLCLRGCSKEEILECFAAELGHLNYLAATCAGTKLLDIYKPRLAKLQCSVESAIEQNLTLIMSGDENKTLLRKTLIICSVLDCSSVAERVVQGALGPSIREHISEASLKSNPRGLSGVLNALLGHIQSKLSSILALTVPQRQQHSAISEIVPGFTFLECSVFPEVISALCALPDFFSPANPNAFHQKYEECISFIASLEEMMVSRERVERFRQSQDYVSFMEKWNFAVYFQIRNQEIGQVVESSLCEKQSAPEGPFEKGSLRLPSSRGVLRGLRQCWQEEVFLQPLLHRFWKMTLLILSRHRTWLTETVKSLQGNNFTFKGTSKLSSSVEMAIILISDLSVLGDEVQSLFSEAIANRLEYASEYHRNMVKNLLASESEKLKPFVEDLLEFVAKDVSGSMISALQPVTDTPRLYRRTNRSAPSQAQPYVSAAVAPLEDLRALAGPLLPAPQLSQCTTGICRALTAQYLALTNEVLGSVSKTEESLRRLKRARRGASPALAQGGGLSDEDKIRGQLCEDVKRLGELLSSAGVDLGELPHYTKLSATVLEARTLQKK